MRRNPAGIGAEHGRFQMSELKPAQSEFTAVAKAEGDGVAGNPDRFVNREFSWLQFNRRVLEESQNVSPSAAGARPLPVDLGCQSRRILHGARRRPRRAGARGHRMRSPDGRTPEQQLEQILLEVERLQEDQQKSLSDLFVLLRKERHREHFAPTQLSKDELAWLEDHFLEQIFPVLTPLSIDPAHPFPFIPNLGFSIALQLRHLKDGKEMTALLRLPTGAEALHPAARPQVGSPLHPARGDGRPVHRQAVPRLRGQGFGHVPHHPRQRYRGRGRGRGSGPLLRDRAEAPPARFGDPHRIRQPDPGGTARFRRRRTGRGRQPHQRADRAAGGEPDLGNRLDRRATT